MSNESTYSNQEYAPLTLETIDEAIRRIRESRPTFGRDAMDEIYMIKKVTYEEFTRS